MACSFKPAKDLVRDLKPLPRPLPFQDCLGELASIAIGGSWQTRTGTCEVRDARYDTCDAAKGWRHRVGWKRVRRRRLNMSDKPAGAPRRQPDTRILSGTH